jgi:hypothetical protein
MAVEEPAGTSNNSLTSSSASRRTATATTTAVYTHLNISTTRRDPHLGLRVRAGGLDAVHHGAQIGRVNMRLHRGLRKKE